MIRRSLIDRSHGLLLITVLLAADAWPPAFAAAAPARPGPRDRRHADRRRQDRGRHHLPTRRSACLRRPLRRRRRLSQLAGLDPRGRAITPTALEGEHFIAPGTASIPCGAGRVFAAGDAATATTGTRISCFRAGRDRPRPVGDGRGLGRDLQLRHRAWLRLLPDRSRPRRRLGAPGDLDGQQTGPSTKSPSTLDPGDYVGRRRDQIRLALRFTDGGWSPMRTAASNPRRRPVSTTSR